jgi:hypothetical protein
MGCWIALALLAVVIIAGWLLLPRLLCMAVNTTLPRELGPQATLLALEPAAHRLRDQPPILLEVDPALMRHIAGEASGRWIPPGIMRHGMGAVGTLRGTGNVAVAWRVVAMDGVVPPRLSIALTPQQADALLAGAINAGTVGGMTLVPELTAVEIAALPDDGENRRFRIEASGALRLQSGSVSMRLPVRRLVAQLTVEFTPAAGGWEPGVQLVIDVLESPLPPIPGIDESTWRRLLGTWVQDRIADQLSGRTIPAWFPTDLQISAVVR